MPASLAYDSLMADITGASPAVNFVTGFFKLMLVNGYAPNQGTDATRADVSHETVGTGYTSGGLPATVGLNLSETAHILSIMMSNVVWSGSNTFSATGAVLYQANGGAPSGDPLVNYIDFGGTVSCVAGPFTAAWTSPLQFDNTSS
jgi:hypothetical protein